MILHILNQPPSHTAAQQNCVRALQPDDAIVLIESAVYSQQSLKESLPAGLNCNIYVLSDDAHARGVAIELGVGIDYSQMVELVANYQRTISWT